MTRNHPAELWRYQADVEPDLASDEWLAKWAPQCPDGNPQRVAELLGFRLKGEDYLQLRAVLPGGPWGGSCTRLVDEHEERVDVRVLLCSPLDTREVTTECDCPFNVWLDAPLGERNVVDVDTGRELPLFIPNWDTDEPSLYVPRPPGSLWPPGDLDEFPRARNAR